VPPVITTAPPCAAAPTAVQHDVDYGPSLLDVYPVPGGCADGVVVFVHGGGYCCGDKTNDIGSTIPWFHAQHWAVVSINYRLNIRYPAFDDDVATAIRWVHAHAASFGADGRHIALLGHSTGAEMVAEVGTTPTLLGATGGLSCVGALDGGAYDIPLAMTTLSPKGLAVYQKPYGISPAGWRAASAITYATAGHGIPRFLVVERMSDTAATVTQQRRFVSALRAAGVPVAVIDADGLTHSQVITEIGAPGDRVMSAPMAAFLRGC
jgi:acetyl esterase/lipase